MAPIEPGACSPATAPAIFSIALFIEAGFANQPTSVSREDGLILRDAYIAAPVRCVPPDNKPTLEEIHACRPFLEREMALLKHVKLVVVLGGIALAGVSGDPARRGQIKARSAFRFQPRRESSSHMRAVHRFWQAIIRASRIPPPAA